MMRLLYGFVAGLCWCFIGSKIIQYIGVPISDEMQFLSLAIVVAGAMAGGG